MLLVESYSFSVAEQSGPEGSSWEEWRCCGFLEEAA